MLCCFLLFNMLTVIMFKFVEGGTSRHQTSQNIFDAKQQNLCSHSICIFICLDEYELQQKKVSAPIIRQETMAIFSLTVKNILIRTVSSIITGRCVIKCFFVCQINISQKN